MKKTSFSGSKISLKDFNDKDFNKLKQWIADPHINKYLNDYERNLSMKKLKELFPLDKQQKKDILFSINYIKENLLIGICGLQKINLNRKDTFMRIIIGDKKFWNGSVAFETENLLLNYAFKKKKLNKVYSIINTKNLGQCKLVERLGMKRDGVLRDYIIQNGKYHNAFLYSILAREFKKS